jgi:hypothetical protein
MADQGDFQNGQQEPSELDLHFLAMNFLELAPRDYDLAAKALALAKQHLDFMHGKTGQGD